MKLAGATLDGKPALLVAETELGRHVYSAFVDIPPGGTRTFTLDFAGTVDLRAGDYHFDYLPAGAAQPGSGRVDGPGRHSRGHPRRRSRSGSGGRRALRARRVGHSVR